MHIKQTGFEGLLEIEHFQAADQRGLFVKTFNDTFFNEQGIPFQAKEMYYSISEKNTVRGMHFQEPPYSHDKIIYVTSGSAVHVVLDLRKESVTYGQHKSFELNVHTQSLFIPKGMAYGFLALEANTCMMYCVSSVYNKQVDLGIKWDSFGFDWQVENPIISNRDEQFPDFSNYKSPF